MPHCCLPPVNNHSHEQRAASQQSRATNHARARHRRAQSTARGAWRGLPDTNATQACAVACGATPLATRASARDASAANIKTSRGQGKIRFWLRARLATNARRRVESRAALHTAHTQTRVSHTHTHARASRQQRGAAATHREQTSLTATLRANSPPADDAAAAANRFVELRATAQQAVLSETRSLHRERSASPRRTGYRCPKGP